jgi:hypothetical protein
MTVIGALMLSSSAGFAQQLARRDLGMNDGKTRLLQFAGPALSLAVKIEPGNSAEFTLRHGNRTATLVPPTGPQERE